MAGSQARSGVDAATLHATGEIEGWEHLQKRLEEQALMLDLAEAEEELPVAEEIAVP